MATASRHSLALITGTAVVAATVMVLIPAIPQNVGYHEFADQRDILGIPNFWNVLTNLPFVIVGLLGLHLLVEGPMPGGMAELRRNYLYFFLGVLLVGFGSSYYHLHPSNRTLLWDRMPLTVAFMALLSALIGEHIDVRAGRILLVPLMVTGLGSVLYWHATELMGRGDLRPYLLVQFLPMALLPILLLFYRSRLSGAAYLWVVLVLYAAAKLLELQDRPIFGALGGISGHSLKHLSAAMGAYAFLVALRNRRTAGR